MLSLAHALNIDIPIPSLFETTTSICFPNEAVHVPIAFPAVAASHVAPAEFFISCDANSLIVYVFPLTSKVASFTAFDVPSTFVPAGDESTLPSFSTAVPSAERTPHVRAIESLCPISPIART